MNLKKSLHSISHFKWLFLFAEVILIIYCLVVLPENLISLIGIIIFITGIQLGLESLSDIEKISAKEIERIKTTTFINKIASILFSAIILLVIISTLFMSLKFVFPEGNTILFNSFFDLGLDCWALILGLLCQLKSIYDKESYVKSLKPVESQEAKDLIPEETQTN